MVVKKSKKAGGAAQEENNGDLAAMGGTLEDYFNSKKAYQSDHMRELNKEVTKHLLTGSGANNAMVMDKEESEGDGVSSTRVEVGGEASEAKDVEEGDAKTTREEGKALENEPRRRPSESAGSANEYEDDYESDSSANAVDTSVAGMTLGDYLHAKGDGVVPLESKEHDVDPDAKLAPPKHDKLPQKPSATNKKPLPPAVISGMSLDYYLGVSSEAGDDNDDYSYHADSKSPTKGKKHKHGHKGKAKGLLASLPARQPPLHDHSAHDEFATPYQKRMKKQLKLKQQHMSQGGAVAKSILLGDSQSSSQLLMAKHLPTSSSPSTTATQKDKRKHSTSSQHPLPKLGSSSSAHNFASAGNHREVHSDDDGGASDGGTSADEKLPPLQHQHQGHK